MRRGRPTFGRERAAERDWHRYQRLNDAVRQEVANSDADERERVANGGRARVRVISVQQNGSIFPLALGMIVAFAKSYRGGLLREHYLFHPDWLIRPAKVRALTRQPSVAGKAKSPSPRY
jgi:hypothetical protein